MTKEFFQDLLALAEKYDFDIIMPSEREGNEVVISIYLDLKAKELVFDPENCNGKMVDVYCKGEKKDVLPEGNIKPVGGC